MSILLKFFVERGNLRSVINHSVYGRCDQDLQLQCTQLGNLYKKGFCLCYTCVNSNSYFLCKFERHTRPGGEKQVCMIFPFGIKCDGERILVQTLFGLTTYQSNFIWNIPAKNITYFHVEGFYPVRESIKYIPIIEDDRNLLCNFGSLLDKDDSLISASTFVDQTNVDLREILSSPQAKAFRRVVCSILHNRLQHHLFQSYLRSRGFDVSILKQNKYRGIWNISPLANRVVLKWNVWNTVPKNDWLQSLWSELKAYKK